MRDYMDRRVTPPKWVTSPTWGPSPPRKQVLSRVALRMRMSGSLLSHQMQWVVPNKCRLFGLHERVLALGTNYSTRGKSTFQLVPFKSVFQTEKASLISVPEGDVWIPRGGCLVFDKLDLDSPVANLNTIKICIQYNNQYRYKTLEVLPKMAHTGKPHPKVVPFFGLRYMNGYGFHSLKSRKGMEICHCGLW